MINKGRTILLAVLFLSLAACAIIFYPAERKKKELSEDFIELSKMEYGMFNLDTWNGILAGIMASKIEEFNLENQTRDKMQPRISGFLYELIDGLEQRYYRDNQNAQWGGLRNLGAQWFGIFDQMKGDIPIFTRQILDFLDDEQNREALKGYLKKHLDDYSHQTFSETDYSLHNAILAKYGQTSREDAKAHLQKALTSARKEAAPLRFITWVLIFAGFALALFNKKLTRPDFLILTGFTFILLLLGVLLPMIAIDARITEMRFFLLGEPVVFTDQVLYYKSKSILEVVTLMITQGKVELVLVAVLVLSFSVLFPMSKLLGTLMYLYRPVLRNKRWLQFLVFRTGKWSMADVMVVAIFMAYLGFSGIVGEQLGQVEGTMKSMELLTTNQSDLQPGFYLFLAFAVFSLLLAHRLLHSPSTQKPT